MESKPFVDTLLQGFNSGYKDTRFSDYSSEAQRQLVVAALLDLYKAEAMGGSGPGTLNRNLLELEKHVELVLSSLNKQM